MLDPVLWFHCVPNDISEEVPSRPPAILMLWFFDIDREFLNGMQLVRFYAIRQLNLQMYHSILPNFE